MSNRDLVSSDKITFFQRTILKWFLRYGRIYPWRSEKDPFKILIAEIMLQRTRADQVLPVYEKFILKYHNPELLSNLSINDIQFFFSKLGLIWRSKLMKEMSMHLIRDYQGRVPSNKQHLLLLPGIGNYIADAVTVFAFNQRRTVIDSNVIRVVSRFFGIQTAGEMRYNKNFITFCQRLSENIPSEDVKKLNWALLDLGALICKPHAICNLCPMNTGCGYGHVFLYKEDS